MIYVLVKWKLPANVCMCTSVTLWSFLYDSFLYCHLLGASLGYEIQVQLNLKVNSTYLALNLSLFLFHSDVTRHLHHFSFKLLFLHLLICHLSCSTAGSVTVVCSLYASKTFLASLFWFVNLNLEHYLAPCSGQVPLKYLVSWVIFVVWKMWIWPLIPVQ